MNVSYKSIASLGGGILGACGSCDRYAGGWPPVHRAVSSIQFYAVEVRDVSLAQTNAAATRSIYARPMVRPWFSYFDETWADAPATADSPRASHENLVRPPSQKAAASQSRPGPFR